MRSIIKTIIQLASPFLLCPSLLYGAEPPNISDAMRQAQPPKEMEQRKSDIPVIHVQEQNLLSAETDIGKKILVKQLVLTGAVHMGNDEFSAMVAPYANKELSFKEIENVAQLVTNAYRKKGYFVARAFVPKQNLLTQDGLLKIEVVEGHYGEFHVKNSSRVSDARVRGLFDDIKERDIISNASLERALLIANDTPGLKVTAVNVRRGTAVETSDFDVVAEAAEPWGANVIGDNYGSKYTGRYKLNVGVNANSPLGYGDKFGINGLLSTNTDLKNGRVFYNFPLMNNGLRAEVATSVTTYSLAEEYKTLDALGTSNTLEASVKYPIIKTKKETLDVTLGYAHKYMKDEVRSVADTTRKEADVANLCLSYMKNASLFGLNNTMNASTTLTFGNLKFNDADKLSTDQSGAKTNGTYVKIAGSLENTLDFDSAFSLTTTLKFQKALGKKNLDGSEDFSLGGAYGVRAFPDGEHSAENGYLVGAELFYNLPKFKGLSHKASIFADTGYAEMENPTGATAGRQLSDIGLGYQANYKSFFAKAQIATVIGGDKSETEDKATTRFLLQIGWTY